MRARVSVRVEAHTLQQSNSQLEDGGMPLQHECLPTYECCVCARVRVEEHLRKEFAHNV